MGDDFNVFDFSAGKRRRGNNFMLINKKDDEGWIWDIAISAKDIPRVGDVVFLGLDHDDVRAGIIRRVANSINRDEILMAIETLGDGAYICEVDLKISDDPRGDEIKSLWENIKEKDNG